MPTGERRGPTRCAALAAVAALVLGAPAGAVAASLGFNNARQLVRTGNGTVALVWLDGARVLLGEVRAADASVVSETVIAEGAASAPAVARRGKALAVAWVAGGIVQVRLRVGGSWQAVESLGAGVAPSLAAARRRFGITWHASDEQTVLFAHRSTGKAGAWSSPLALATGGDERVAFATLAGRGSRFVAAWKRGGLAGWEVELRRSGDRGSSWDVARRLGEGGDPAICLAGRSRAWVGLQRDAGGVAVLVSTDGGETFTAHTVGDGWFAHVSCSRRRTLVAWEDTPYPPAHPDEDVKAFGLARVTAGGAVTILAQPAGSRVASPTVLLHRGRATVAWIDTTGGGGLSGTLRLAAAPL